MNKTAKLARILAATVCTLAIGTTSARAQSHDEDDYEAIGHDENGDGSDDYWTVSRDGGETQVGGVYTTRRAAKRAARKAARVLKRVRRKLDKIEK